MKKFVIALLSVTAILFNTLEGQEAITLPGCYEDALLAHPLSGEKKIQYQLWQLKDKNIASGWYPTVDAGATFLYNTNVVDLGSALDALPIPGLIVDIGTMPNENYKLTLDVNQIIWDGGAIKNSRNLAEKSKQVSEQDIEIELYKIRERINTLFFNTLLLKRQKNLLLAYNGLITKRVQSAQSAIENGVLLPSEKSAIIAERIKIEQQIKETDIKINSLCQVLSDITGRDIQPNSELILPEASIEYNSQITRPELTLIDLRIEQLEANKSLIESTRMPKAFGFATIGYGSPAGNDFFTDEFGPYAIFGAGIKWNIFDWNRSKRNGQIIDLNRSALSNRRSDIENNLNRALISKGSEISELSTMLETDSELIELRKSITMASESQFRNGTITSTEYMRILNLEKEAILSQHIHQVSLIKAQVEYLNITGTELK